MWESAPWGAKSHIQIRCVGELLHLHSRIPCERAGAKLLSGTANLFARAIVLIVFPPIATDFGSELQRDGGGEQVLSVRVLVVDDFEPWRRFIYSMLEKGPELRVIFEASDGLEAVQKAEELKPDLILLDIGLPKLDGIEAARRIRKLAPESKILFLSQESSADVVQGALSLGALGYVVKANAASELLPAVEAVLRGTQFVGSGVKDYEFSGGADAQAPHWHEILFCSDDTVLLDTFTRVVAAAVNTGNAAIILVTEPHRALLLQSLEKLGLDVERAIQEGTYIVLDVNEALSAIMVSGLPDPVRFFGGINGFIKAAAKAAKTKQPRIVVCGESAALLRAQGKADAAIRLGQLCDELAKTHEVDVLCAQLRSPIPGVET
jgi:DNA-binding NarL/FixJ family response regulator